MYAFRISASGRRVLVEMTPQIKQLALEGGLDERGSRYVACRVQLAHEWVRQDNVHETALWVDTNGRVRRASDNN